MSSAAVEYPPVCNTGGTSLGQVGGSINSKTIIDTISWSVPADVDEQRKAARELAAYVLTLFPDGVTWGEREDAKQGYVSQVRLMSGSIVLGWLAWGAYHGMMWLYLGGAGLRCRRDAGLLDTDLVRVTREVEGARLGRLDIALDLYDHGKFSVEQSIAAHASGRYRPLKSPKDPHQEMYWSETSNEAYPIARTHYVGRPNASKRLTVYDKGLQILGRMSPDDVEEYRSKGVIQSDDVPEGAHIEEWTRVELRYHHDKRRPLDPEEMIGDPDGTFAGAYPMLAELLDVSDGFRPSYLPREEQCEYARLLMAGKESYGGLVFSLVEDLGWEAQRIVDALKGPKRAARLMVDKERPSDGVEKE